MSQIVDLDAWVAGSAEQEQLHADVDATAPIPALTPDRRRRPLPSGRDLGIDLGAQFMPRLLPQSPDAE